MYLIGGYPFGFQFPTRIRNRIKYCESIDEAVYLFELIQIKYKDQLSCNEDLITDFDWLIEISLTRLLNLGTIEVIQID